MMNGLDERGEHPQLLSPPSRAALGLWRAPTRSRMMSAVPMSGAASSAPSALRSTTFSKPFSAKNCLAMLW